MSSDDVVLHQQPLPPPEHPQKVNQYGFIVSPNSSSGNILSTADRKELNKAQEEGFLTLLNQESDWQNLRRRSRKKLRKLCRLGIPESLRAQVWSKLAGVDSLRQPGVFQEYALKENEDIPIFEVIERDIHRCYPDHILFKEVGGQGQQQLRSVLRAYALYNPDVEYCQGMGFLVGLMLMHMPAEDAFWLLAATIKNFAGGFYDRSLSQVQIDANVFESLLRSKCRKLADTLKKNEIQPVLFITKWFITFFTSTLPWETVLRVWDMFYYDGIKAFFRVALAIMKSCEAYILKTCQSQADILEFMLHIPEKPYLETEILMKTALKVRLSTHEVELLRIKENQKYQRSRMAL